MNWLSLILNLRLNLFGGLIFVFLIFKGCDNKFEKTESFLNGLTSSMMEIFEIFYKNINYIGDKKKLVFLRLL